MSFGNPVQGPRVVPFGQARTSKDYLPNGHPGFRVTQRFSDWDAFFRNRIHGATDLGNFYCGDAVIAMEGGWVTHLRDPNGALGVRLHHANGWATEYWHLSSIAVASGSWAKKGQVIGRVGSTGLDIGGCHLHLKMQTATGVWVDAGRYLDYSLETTLPDTSTTLYVKFNAGVDGVRLRRSPDARLNNIFATVWKAGDGRVGTDIRLGTERDGKWIGNTEARRTLFRVVKGADGHYYNQLRLAGTGVDSFCQSQFMHRV